MVNDYCNSLVTEAMRGMKYVNMFNRGVRSVRKLLEENNNPEPHFNVNLVTVFHAVAGQATDEENQIISAKNDKINGKKELIERQQILTMNPPGVLL